VKTSFCAFFNSFCVLGEYAESILTYSENTANVHGVIVHGEWCAELISALKEKTMNLGMLLLHKIVSKSVFSYTDNTHKENTQRWKIY
jgi:hypothetical protein